MNHAKKNFKRLASIASTTLLLTTQAGATAAPISFGITSVVWALGSGWGSACTGAGCDTSHTHVNAGWTIAPGVAGKTFILTDVGDAFSFKFGSVKLGEEDAKFNSTELHNLGVLGTFNLSAPTTTNENTTATVVAKSGALNDSANDLTISFDPIYVNFGNGGQFRIDLSSLAWNCNTGNKDCSVTRLGNGTIRDQSVTNDVRATFTLTQLEDVTATANGDQLTAAPEPGVIALMGFGLASLGFSRRKCV